MRDRQSKTMNEVSGYKGVGKLWWRNCFRMMKREQFFFNSPTLDDLNFMKLGQG